MHKSEQKSEHYGVGDIPKQEATSLFLISLPHNIQYSYGLIPQLFKATLTKTSAISQNSYTLLKVPNSSVHLPCSPRILEASSKSLLDDKHTWLMEEIYHFQIYKGGVLIWLSAAATCTINFQELLVSLRLIVLKISWILQVMGSSLSLSGAFQEEKAIKRVQLKGRLQA